MEGQDVRRPKGCENEDSVGTKSKQDFIPSDVVGLSTVRSYRTFIELFEFAELIMIIVTYLPLSWTC